VIDCQTDTMAFSEGPIAMTINKVHKSSLLRRLAGWWRSRCSPRVRASVSVRVADAGEAAARGANASDSKPGVLAGKWPRAANSIDQLNAFHDEPGGAQACSPLVEGKA
jgi:hypothetical protein